MKTIKLTARQMEVIYHSVDEKSPTILQDQFEAVENKVFKTKNPFTLQVNKEAVRWLKSEAKSFVKHLKEEIKDAKSMTTDKDKDYWQDEAYYHTFRIKALNNLLTKLN